MLTIIEVQIGAYLGEDDIIRYEDVYSRKWAQMDVLFTLLLTMDVGLVRSLGLGLGNINEIRKINHFCWYIIVIKVTESSF